MTPARIEAIDALLPQTQCGKCGHPGCRPYAEGIAGGEAINKCPPGGQQTVAQLATLLGIAPLPLEQPPVPPQVAVIREAECIGCTKCIQACPVDAIVGAAKLMHTVIRDECSGCELCLAPCPVDCIDLLPLPAAEAQLQRQRAGQFRRRHEARLARLAAADTRRRAERQAIARRTLPAETAAPSADAERKRLQIEAAQLRMALSRAQKQLALHGTAELQAQVDTLLAASQAAETRLRQGDTAAPVGAAALNRAKIAAALARSQLAKARKAFGAATDVGQQRQLQTLEEAVERAERDLAQLSRAPLDTDALRQAKVALVARRTELRNAERQGADEPRLVELRDAVTRAEQALHTTEAASGRPQPARTYPPLPAQAARRRELKTELAHARAALSKLQRRKPDDSAALADATRRLAEAERRLYDHEHALVSSEDHR